MKGKRLLIFSGLVILFLLSSFSSLYSEEAYPLMCRNGTLTIIFKQKKLYIENLTGETEPASKRPPHAGSCAWLDRGFRKDEVDQRGQIILTLTNFSFEIEQINCDTSTRCFVITSDERINNLIKSILNGLTYYLHIKRRSGHIYDIIRIGP